MKQIAWPWRIKRGLSGRKQPKGGTLNNLAPQIRIANAWYCGCNVVFLVVAEITEILQKIACQARIMHYRGHSQNEKSSPPDPLFSRLRRVLASHSFGSLHVAVAAIKPATLQVRF